MFQMRKRERKSNNNRIIVVSACIVMIAFNNRVHIERKIALTNWIHYWELIIISPFIIGKSGNNALCSIKGIK